jgi:MFS family permease
MDADETQPLLAKVLSRDIATDDVVLNNNAITFEEGDTDNPLEWPRSYKWGVIMLLAFMAFTVTFTCIGIVPIARTIVSDLEGEENKSTSVLLVTIWELGEAAGPLVIAPLSEVYGRYPVFNIANLLFILWTLIAASCQTSGLFIFARFITGCAVASNVLNPAIIGDMLPPEERGTAMATLMLAPLLGGAVGPAIAGAIAESIGWRQVLLAAAGIAGVCEVAFLLLLRETYKLSILKHRAAKLRKEGRDLSLPEEESTTVAVWRSIKRPATVIYGSLVLQLLSLFGALWFSYFYVMATTLPVILRDIYDFSPALTGSSFLCFSKSLYYASHLHGNGPG